MAKLKIENFGPIKNVEFELKKFNVFIGQQGTGKSCILKIAAFCKWLEKVYSTTEVQYLKKSMTDAEFLKEYLIAFYKLDFNCHNYSIFYESDDIKFDIFEGKINISGTKDLQTKQRVAYIPAERCLVAAIPNLMSLRIRQNTNIYKYLVDWEDAHKLYAQKTFSVLNLNTYFLYNDTQKIDYLSVDNQTIIPFENASSGFQSLVPICILTDYYLNSDILMSIVEKVTTESDINLKSAPKNCSLFIEEPEANIFPETQYELVKWLVSAVNNGNENSIFVATHSPYILSSFNNLIQAENSALSNTEKRSEINEIMQTKDFVNFNEIGVYEVKDGCINDIKDYDLQIINSNGIDSVSDIIQEQFSKLLDYEND
ncbi:MAG: AAA family ATPase [Bacteroidales bacterium]|nr:AAA family ATPase [Bacteroidales bacterium]